MKECKHDPVERSKYVVGKYGEKDKQVFQTVCSKCGEVLSSFVANER